MSLGSLGTEAPNWGNMSNGVFMAHCIGEGMSPGCFISCGGDKILLKVLNLPVPCNHLSTTSASPMREGSASEEASQTILLP